MISERDQRILDLLEANNRYQQEGRNWRIVETLRADEGSSITIICDNPDFNSQPDSKVICSGDWTGWQDREFVGSTVAEALGAALVSYQRWRNTHGH